MTGATYNLPPSLTLTAAAALIFTVVDLRRFNKCQKPLRCVFTTDRKGSRADQSIAVALKLIYRKARCMDRAHVLSDEGSSRVEELLIISTVEAIAVDADRI